MTIQMDAIASASSASWYHSSGTPKLSCKQCLCIYKASCLARACWTQPKPVVLHRADAGFAFFQNALSALRRSAQPSRAVMFTGIGIVSQQAEHARQSFNAVRILAFVRTKALLADATWLNRFISSSLGFFSESSDQPGATVRNPVRLLSTSVRLRLLSK